MFKSSWEICRPFGIPVRADISLLILFFLMSGRFQSPYYDLLGFMVLVLSIVLHELGHSLVARAFGCRVVDIKLMFIGGAARMASMPRKAWQEFLMALAGPAVSFALGIVGILLFQPGEGYDFFGRPILRFSSQTSYVLYCSLGWGNLLLGFFNLVPAFPMDGGRVLRSVLQQFFTNRLRATWIAARVGRAIAAIFAISAILNIFNIQLIPFLGGTFNLLLIAWFVWQSAESEYRIVLMEEGGSAGNFWSRFFRNGQFRPNPFTPPEAPPDDGKATISPPPYGGTRSRVDVRRN